MSTSSPQAEAATQQSQWQGQLAKMLSETTWPELQSLLGGGGKHWVSVPGGPGGGYWANWDGSESKEGILPGMLSSMDASGRMAPDAAILNAAKGQLNQSYGQAQMGSKEAISYGALRSGEGRLSPGATSSAITSAATSLDRDRASALRNLEFMSAQSSLKDYNQVLQLLGQGTQASLGLAQGFSGSAGAAIGGLSGQSQFGSTLGGAATGASLGAYGGIYGALAGGVIGGAIGYGTSG
jgi:hypothetical protein